MFPLNFGICERPSGRTPYGLCNTFTSGVKPANVALVLSPLLSCIYFLIKPKGLSLYSTLNVKTVIFFLIFTKK